MKTKGELAAEQLAGETFDCALPQSWVDNLQAELGLPNEVNIAGQFVWHYPKGNIFGKPHPLTAMAASWLQGVQA